MVEHLNMEEPIDKIKILERKLNEVIDAVNMLEKKVYSLPEDVGLCKPQCEHKWINCQDYCLGGKLMKKDFCRVCGQEKEG